MNELVERGTQAREQTLDLLNEIVAKTTEFELPGTESELSALTAIGDGLADNINNILVIGEAKRGKSTFVNALIGETILPTDVDVATSQVFRVKVAKQESYRIRFEDGSTQEITRDKLPLYGSQVMVDAGKVPQLNQITRWIEIDIPALFIPDNIIIMDTPGLGTLHSAHTQITQRWVPQADAVIYVLDSRQPMVQDDLNFLAQILDVTNHIFFIQTWIDAFYPEEWQAVLERNEEILNENFGDALLDCRVWPISSLNLLTAAEEDDEDYYMVSQYPEMATALKSFLYRVTYWRRTSIAALTLVPHHATGQQALSARLSMATEENPETYLNASEMIENRKKQFEEKWGPKGQKRREILETTKKTLRVARQDFAQHIKPQSGIIAREIRREIDQLESIKALQAFASDLEGVIKSEVSVAWTRTAEQAVEHCVTVLSEFVQETQTLSIIPVTNKDKDVPNSISVLTPEIEANMLSRLMGAKSGMMIGKGAASALALGWKYTMTWTAMDVLIGPTLATAVGTALTGVGIVLVPVAVWAFIHTSKKEAKRQFHQAAEEIKHTIDELLTDLNQYFFDVDIKTGSDSIVDEFFSVLQQQVKDQIQVLVQQKTEEIQREIQRINQESNLDMQQRKEKRDLIRDQLDYWDKLGQSLANVISDLNVIEQEFETLYRVEFNH